MTAYGKLIPMFVFVGFEMFVFSMARVGDLENSDEVRGLVISAYVAYVFAFILSAGFYMGGLEKNKIGKIAVTVLAIAAGVLIIAALAVHGDHTGNHKRDAYVNTLFSSCALMAVVAAVCGVVQLIKDD